MKADPSARGQDQGRGPTGEKHPCRAVAGGERATHITGQCGLCALLQECRKKSAERQAPGRALHGLRIALVDGDKAVCHAVRQMVQAQRDGWILEAFHPCGAAEAPSPVRVASSQAVLEAHHPQALRPDIVLVGVGSSGPSRLGCVRKLKALAPKLPVVVISGQSDEVWLVQCCLAGADGCLLKTTTRDALARAVNSAVQGQPVLCPEAEKAVVNFVHRMGAALWFRHLSRREQEIVVCLAEKLSDKEIAERLGITNSTVHMHLLHLYHKLEAHTRAQAVSKLLGASGGMA
jgi:DNA-binding NarL/FixJ family response regulator